MKTTNLTELKEALAMNQQCEVEHHFDQDTLETLSNRIEGMSYTSYTINDDKDIVMISLGTNRYYAYLEANNFVMEKIQDIDSIEELTESFVQEVFAEIKNELEEQKRKANEFLLYVRYQATNSGIDLSTPYSLSNEKLEQSLLVETKKGKIAAKVCDDPYYPSIQVSVNDELATVVEFDVDQDNFRIHTYSKEKDHPEVSLNFGEENQD